MPALFFMRCPHCYRTLRTYESISAVGIVMRVRDCHTCKLRYRTEERSIQETPIPERIRVRPATRRAEREQWHRER